MDSNESKSPLYGGSYRIEWTQYQLRQRHNKDNIGKVNQQCGLHRERFAEVGLREAVSPLRSLSIFATNVSTQVDCILNEVSPFSLTTERLEESL